MTVHALTKAYSAVTNKIVTEAAIINPEDNSICDTYGIWDTGATNSVITKKLATELQLPIRGFTDVGGIGGVIPDVPVYLVKIRLNNENIVVRALVTECEKLSPDESIGLLIGMNVITQGDFSISNFEGKTLMSFRVPSLTHIDYVQEILDSNKYKLMHEKNLKAHRPDVCGCGSGKLYKNCHGKDLYSK